MARASKAALLAGLLATAALFTVVAAQSDYDHHMYRRCYRSCVRNCDDDRDDAISISRAHKLAITEDDDDGDYDNDEDDNDDEDDDDHDCKEECREDCTDYVPAMCYRKCVSSYCLFMPPCKPNESPIKSCIVLNFARLTSKLDHASCLPCWSKRYFYHLVLVYV
jgi:hypothetical protein